MVRRFIIKVLVCGLAIWVADYLLAGVTVYGGWTSYLLAGLLLGFLNTFIRPVIKLLALPLIMLTLGLFTFLINAGILWAVSAVLESVRIDGLWPLAWATLIVSVVNMLFEPAIDD